MTIFIILASVLGYLLGARGTYGFIKWHNWLEIKLHDQICSHGYMQIHRGEECHPAIPSKEATELSRVPAAMLWPVWIPLVFLYIIITGKWER